MVCSFLCKPPCTEIFYPFLQKGDEGEEGVTSEGMKNYFIYATVQKFGGLFFFGRFCCFCF